MANLPALRTESSYELNPAKTDTVRKLLAKGWTASQIAYKLAPKDDRKRRNIRRKVHSVAARDDERRAHIAIAALGTLTEGADDMAEALLKRAKRGRVDAIKLAFEMIGVYVPHSHKSVEHSGEVKVTFTAVPRPPRTEEEPVDATVVED